MVHRSYGASTIEDEDQHPSLRRLILELAGDLAGLRITLLGEPHEAERHLVRQTEEHAAVQLPAIAAQNREENYPRRIQGQDDDYADPAEDRGG